VSLNSATEQLREYNAHMPHDIQLSNINMTEGYGITALQV
jgi:hypothetical protein